jgi:hypothetical protein
VLPRSVIIRRLVFVLPFYVLMYFLGVSKGQWLGVPLSGIWLSMITVIIAYVIAIKVMAFMMHENEDGTISMRTFLINTEQGPPQKAVYVIYAYGILLGGAASTIIVEFFSFFITQEYSLLTSLIVIFADSVAALAVISSYHTEYGTKKFRQPNTSPKQPKEIWSD